MFMKIHITIVRLVVHSKWQMRVLKTVLRNIARKDRKGTHMKLRRVRVRVCSLSL